MCYAYKYVATYTAVSISYRICHFADIGPVATGAPNAGGNSGGIAAGVIVVVILALAAGTLLIVGLLFMKKRKAKYRTSDEAYAHFV